MFGAVDTSCWTFPDMPRFVRGSSNLTCIPTGVNQWHKQAKPPLRPEQSSFGALPDSVRTFVAVSAGTAIIWQEPSRRGGLHR